MGCREFTYLFLGEKTPEDRNIIASSSAQYPALSTQHLAPSTQHPAPASGRASALPTAGFQGILFSECPLL